MTRRMTLCPNCRTIQKAQAICTICGTRVVKRPVAEAAGEGTRWRRVGEWRDVISPYGFPPRSSN